MKGDRFRKIAAGMWADENFRSLSDDGKLLWFRFLTGPEVTILPGLLVVGRAGLAEAMGWPVSRLDEAFRPMTMTKVSGEPMALADWSVRLIWLPRGLDHNAPGNPNVVRGWKSAWRSVPECPLKERARLTLSSGLSAISEAFAKAFAELSVGLSGSNSEPLLARARAAPAPASSSSDVSSLPDPESKPQAAEAVALRSLPDRFRELAEGVAMTAGPFDVEDEWAKFQVSGKPQTDLDWQRWCVHGASYARRDRDRRREKSYCPGFDEAEAGAAWCARWEIPEGHPELRRFLDHHRKEGKPRADWAAAWRDWLDPPFVRAPHELVKPGPLPRIDFNQRRIG